MLCFFTLWTFFYKSGIYKFTAKFSSLRPMKVRMCCVWGVKVPPLVVKWILPDMKTYHPYIPNIYLVFQFCQISCDIDPIYKHTSNDQRPVMFDDYSHIKAESSWSSEVIPLPKYETVRNVTLVTLENVVALIMVFLAMVLPYKL